MRSIRCLCVNRIIIFQLRFSHTFFVRMSVFYVKNLFVNINLHKHQHESAWKKKCIHSMKLEFFGFSCFARVKCKTIKELTAVVLEKSTLKLSSYMFFFRARNVIKKNIWCIFYYVNTEFITWHLNAFHAHRERQRIVIIVKLR